MRRRGRGKDKLLFLQWYGIKKQTVIIVFAIVFKQTSLMGTVRTQNL